MTIIGHHTDSETVQIFKYRLNFDETLNTKVFYTIHLLLGIHRQFFLFIFISGEGKLHGEQMHDHSYFHNYSTLI